MSHSEQDLEQLVEVILLTFIRLKKKNRCSKLRNIQQLEGMDSVKGNKLVVQEKSLNQLFEDIMAQWDKQDLTCSLD